MELRDNDLQLRFTKQIQEFYDNMSKFAHEYIWEMCSSCCQDMCGLEWKQNLAKDNDEISEIGEENVFHEK